MSTDTAVSREAYNRAPATMKAEAERRLKAMVRLGRLLKGGMAAMEAYAAVAEQFEDSVSTVRRAWKSVRTVDEDLWIDVLTKGYKGGQRREIDPRMWQAFRKDYDRLEEPQAQAVWERVRDAAALEGWGPVPSVQAFMRRWNDLPAEERIKLRKGVKAAQDHKVFKLRDRSASVAMDGWNMDARIWDLRVEWPNGKVRRPVVTMIEDEASNYVLGYEVGESESGDGYRRVICGAVAKYGKPDRILFDNTRAAANKPLTGGSKSRHRFKEDVDQIEGILPRLKIDPDFAKVANGREKLVERAFLSTKERTEKHPLCEGAYTGRSPSEKPANYGERAVPLAVFLQLMAKEVERYNNFADGRGSVTYKKSPREVFDGQRQSIAVVKLTARQLRLLTLVQCVRTLTPNGTVILGEGPHKRFYHTGELSEFGGQKVVVRYDADDFSAAIQVELTDKSRTWENVPALGTNVFHNRVHERRHQRGEKKVRRLEKEIAATRAELDALEAGTDPETVILEAPDAPVIAPVFGQRKPATKSVRVSGINPDTAAFMAKMQQHLLDRTG